MCQLSSLFNAVCASDFFVWSKLWLYHFFPLHFSCATLYTESTQFPKMCFAQSSMLKSIFLCSTPNIGNIKKEVLDTPVWHVAVWQQYVSFYSGESELSDCKWPESLAENREIARLDVSLTKYRKIINNFVSAEMSHVHIGGICHRNDKHSMVTPVLVKADWFVKFER